ncbi:hypothetical protein DRO64_10530 [Candidatus Bathyarchaeota archaeon]|nr:MAG: hypothetical protein DRO64_10530 [Candidatus Bathyarchaeota archaeon]
MRVIVLGIDGLDADLVLRWRLKAFMQQYYGTHDVRVAVKPGDPLYTPLIWAAFLLGKPAYLYGFDHKLIAMRRARIGYGFPEIFYKIRIKLFGTRKLGIRPLLLKLKLYDIKKIVAKAYEIEALPREALKDTLPEIAKNSGYKVWVREFPSYNDFKCAEWRAKASEFIGIPTKDILKELEKRYQYSIELLQNVIESIENHDLVLYYTPVIDWANHKFYKLDNLKYITILAAYYKKVERSLSDLLKRVRRSAVLILSDHGFDPVRQEHSDHGFWSLNIKPPRIPKTILDFKNIILELLDL